MRFAIFLALLVATFVACASSFASAENFADGFAVFDDAEDNVERRLRADAAVNKDNVAKIAGGFLERAKEKGTLARATQIALNANGDLNAARKAVNLAHGAANGAKLSDETMVKLAAMVAETAKKNPKSWPRLRKFVKVTLGVAAGSLVIYAAYKLLFAKNSSTSTTTTTTTSSPTGTASA